MYILSWALGINLRPGRSSDGPKYHFDVHTFNLAHATVDVSVRGQCPMITLKAFRKTGTGSPTKLMVGHQPAKDARHQTPLGWPLGFVRIATFPVAGYRFEKDPNVIRALFQDEIPN